MQTIPPRTLARFSCGETGNPAKIREWSGVGGAAMAGSAATRIAMTAASGSGGQASGEKLWSQPAAAVKSTTAGTAPATTVVHSGHPHRSGR